VSAALATLNELDATTESLEVFTVLQQIHRNNQQHTRNTAYRRRLSNTIRSVLHNNYIQ